MVSILSIVRVASQIAKTFKTLPSQFSNLALEGGYFIPMISMSFKKIFKKIHLGRNETLAFHEHWSSFTILVFIYTLILNLMPLSLH